MSEVFTVFIYLLVLLGLGLTATEVIRDLTQCKSGCDGFRPLLWDLILEAVALLGSLISINVGLVRKAYFVMVGFLVMGTVAMLDQAQDSLLGKSPMSGAEEYLAGAGCVVLVLLNVGVIVWLGIARKPKGPEAVRDFSSSRFAAMLLVAFGTIIGAFMVGVSSVKKSCNADGCKDVAFKWWGASFALAVMLVVGICEFAALLEGYGTTLAALAAVAASVVMKLADLALPAEDRSEKFQAAGFIVLSVVCLGVVLIIGYTSSEADKVEEGKPWMAAVQEAFTYSLLPLLLGWSLAVAGLAKFSQTCGEACSELRLEYWVLAFQLAVVILASFARTDGYGKMRMPSIIFIALVTMGQMKLAGDHLVAQNLYMSMTAAGFILMSAMNFLLTILMGLEDDTADTSGFTPMIE